MTRFCWMWAPLRPSGSGYRFDQEILLSAIPPGLRAVLPA